MKISQDKERYNKSGIVFSFQKLTNFFINRWIMSETNEEKMSSVRADSKIEEGK